MFSYRREREKAIFGVQLQPSGAGGKGFISEGKKPQKDELVKSHQARS